MDRRAYPFGWRARVARRNINERTPPCHHYSADDRGYEPRPDWLKERRRSTPRRCAGWPLITVDRLDLLSEEEVQGYLLGLRQRGVARGTFQTSRFGLPFSITTTSIVRGDCSGKKGSPRHGKSGCLRRCRRIRSGNCSGVSGTRFTRRVWLWLCTRAACASARLPRSRSAPRWSHRCCVSLARETRSGWCRQAADPPRTRPSAERTHRNRRWLFPNRHGDAPINKRCCRDLSRRRRPSEEIRHGSGPAHALRHSCAIQTIENGVNIRIVQILLGPLTSSTAIYTTISPRPPEHRQHRSLLDRQMIRPPEARTRDRGRRRVPPLRGGLPLRLAARPGCLARIARRHQRTPHLRTLSGGLALRGNARYRDVFLAFLYWPQLPEVPPPRTRVSGTSPGRILQCRGFRRTVTVPAEVREVLRAHQARRFACRADAERYLRGDHRTRPAIPGLRRRHRGVLAVLHTWTQQLNLPSACSLPRQNGGGISEDASTRGISDAAELPGAHQDALDKLVRNKFRLSLLRRKCPNLSSFRTPGVESKRWIYLTSFQPGGDALNQAVLGCYLSPAMSFSSLSPTPASSASTTKRSPIKYQERKMTAQRTAVSSGDEFMQPLPPACVTTRVPQSPLPLGCGITRSATGSNRGRTADVATPVHT